MLKVTSLFIQWAPLAGLSGCTYNLIIVGNNRVKQGGVTLHPVCPASHAVGVHIQPEKQGGGGKIGLNSLFKLKMSNGKGKIKCLNG